MRLKRRWKRQVRSVPPRLGIRLAAVEAAQLVQELPRHAEIVDQAGDGVLELRRVVQVPPFQNPAQQVDAILVGRLREIQVAPRVLVHRRQRLVRLRRQRDGHGNGFALGARILFQILFGEAVEQALHFARQPDQRVPGAVHREIVAAGSR